MTIKAQLDLAFKAAVLALLAWNAIAIHAADDTADQARRHAVAATEQAMQCLKEK